MAFDAIDTAEIQVKKPVTRSLLQKIKDSLDFLNGRIGTIELQGIQNGSFEIDSAADGVPDNWTLSLYPGGTGLLDTANPAHGSQSFKFTHPGGSGNGGGNLLSDYIPCSDCQTYTLDFIHWASGGVTSLVEINYYDQAKVYISTLTIYGGTDGLPVAPSYFVGSFVPLAGTRFIKIELRGGHPGGVAAGSAWFDNIRLNPAAWNMSHSAPLVFAEANTAQEAWTDMGTTTISFPVLSSPALLTFDAEVMGQMAYLRFAVGGAYSNEVYVSSVVWESHTFSLPFVADSSGSCDVVMQIKTGAYTDLAYGRKTASAARVRINL